MVKPKLLDRVREAVRSGISAIGQTRHYYPDQGSARGRAEALDLVLCKKSKIYLDKGQANRYYSKHVELSR